MTPGPSGLRSRNGQAAYLQLREEIEARLKRGSTLTVIYREIGADLPFTYKQFAKYVRRFSMHACPFPYRSRRESPSEVRPAPAPPASPPLRPISVRAPAPAEQGETGRDSAKVGKTMRLL